MNDREQFELLVAKDWDAHDLPNFDLNPLGDYVDDEMFSTFAWFKKGLAARATPAQPVPDAYVPIHPRTGPLWASTIPSKDCDHPSNYELRPVYFAPSPASDVSAPSPSSVGAAIRALKHGRTMSHFATLPACQVFNEGWYEALSAAAALAEQVQGQHWISVKDRLPEFVTRWNSHLEHEKREIPSMILSNRCAVLVDGVVDADRAVQVDGRKGAIWQVYGYRVTHWLPLPAAPSIAQDGQKSEGA